MGNVFVLGLVSLLTDVSSAMVNPLVPVFLIVTLGVSPLTLGLIEGLAESVGGLLKVVFGYASDRVRRRRGLAALGYAISASGKLILAFAGSWGRVLAARMTDRFGKVVRTAPRDALIVESTAPEQKGQAFGLQRAMDAAGSVIGVAVAYLVLLNAAGQVKTVFAWAIVPAALSVLVMLLFVREGKRPAPLPSPAPPEAGPASQLQAPAARPTLRWSTFPQPLRTFLLVTFIFALGNYSNLFIVLKAHELGLVPLYLILLYGVYNLTHALTVYPASRLSDRIGRRGLLVGGYLLFGFTFLAFAFASHAAWYWPLFALYGVYLGLTEGVEKALVADFAPAEFRATAQGLHATVVSTTVLPASVLAGLLWIYVDSAAPFYFSAITAFGATMLLLKRLPR